MAVTLKGFTEVARLTAKASGVENLRIAEYPGPVGVHLPEIRDNVRGVLFEQIIDGLTKEVEDKGSSGAGDICDPGKIVFSGSLEDVNRYFVEKEWSDGGIFGEAG